MKARKKLTVASKWNKVKIILTDSTLAKFQPKTHLYDKDYLLLYLKKFPIVFVKPDNGWGGKYVIRLRTKGNEIEALFGQKLLRFASVDQFDAWYKKIHRGIPFILQQGVLLAPYRGKPVDLRTIIQLNESGKWEVTGMFAKVAKKGMAITNVCAGGTAFRVEQYLSGIGIRGERQKKIFRAMIEISKRIGSVFQQNYTNTIYGIDLGLDTNGKIWIIEVNTRPSISILNRIRRKMYLRAYQLYRYHNKKRHLQAS